MRVNVITLCYSPTLGVIDSAPLSDFVKDKELLSFREHFFRMDGVPHLLCVVSWQDRIVPLPAPARSNGSSSSPSPPAERKRNDDLLSDLSEADRVLFNSFREWRNQIATKEGVSHYLILKNRQVVELIRKRPQSLTALSQFEGIGPKKVEKYGKAILGLLKTTPAATETPG